MSRKREGEAPTLRYRRKLKGASRGEAPFRTSGSTRLT